MPTILFWKYNSHAHADIPQAINHVVERLNASLPKNAKGEVTGDLVYGVMQKWAREPLIVKNTNHLHYEVEEVTDKNERRYRFGIAFNKEGWGWLVLERPHGKRYRDICRIQFTTEIHI